MRFRYYLPVLMAFLIASCGNEEDNSLDSVNASAQINAIAGEMNDDVVTLVQSEGVNGALSLVDLIENSAELGRVTPYEVLENRSFVANQINKISFSFTEGVAVALGQEPDDFTEIKGVYEWNFDLEDFEKTGESDFLIILFPVEESTTNNGEFRLTEFTVVEIDGEELPTSIQADLSVDGSKVIDLDFSVNYDSVGNPETANITLDVLPFALNLTFDDTQAQATSLAVTLFLEGSSLMGVDVDIMFDSEEKLEVNSVAGEVSYLDLRIVGSINDDQMDNSDDSNPNDYIDLALFIGENKAGDIVFILEEIIEDGQTYEDWVPYVEYTDGTQEKLEDILQPVIDEIEDAFEDLD